MLKTQRCVNANNDYNSTVQKIQERRPYQYYNPLIWNSFYHPFSKMFFYPYQLSYVYQSSNLNDHQNTDFSYNGWNTAPIAPVAPICDSMINQASDYEDTTTDDSLNCHIQNPPRYPQYLFCGPTITAYGTISVHLHHYIRVDITVDKAIRLINFPGRCVAAINYIGNNSCIIHPTGKILQEGVNVNLETGNRLAKISKRGVTFTSMEHSLVYLVDASGTKSTVERFQDLSYDFSLDVFYAKAVCGEEALNNCLFALSNSVHRFNNNGDEMWIIAGVCIQQNVIGDVRIARDYGRRVLRTSPTLGTMSVATPFIYMAAGCDPDRYFFVQRGEKRLSAHVKALRVKNGSQKAGFDNKGRLVLC